MRQGQRGEAVTPDAPAGGQPATAPPRRVVDWRSRVKSARRVSVRPSVLTSGALMVLAALITLAVAGYGIVEIDLLWAICAVLAGAGMLFLTLRGFPLFGVLPLLAAGVAWGLAMRVWLPGSWTDILGVLKFIGGNLAFVAPLVGTYLAAIALDSRRVSRAAIEEAVSGRRWWGEPSDVLPQLAELEAIPAVRFFALSGADCSHVVAAGRRVALTRPTVWPRGSYTLDRAGQVQRDGRPFANGSDDLDRLAASVRSWQGRLKGVDATVRGFLVVAPPRDDFGDAVVIEVAPAGNSEVTHSHEFADAAGAWLAVEPYRVDLALTERLLKLRAPAPAEKQLAPGGKRGSRRKRTAAPVPAAGRSDELTANQTGAIPSSGPEPADEAPFTEAAPALPPLDDRPSFDGFSSSFDGAHSAAGSPGVAGFHSFDGSRGYDWSRNTGEPQGLDESRGLDGPGGSDGPPAAAPPPTAALPPTAPPPTVPEPRFGSAFEPVSRFDATPDPKQDGPRDPVRGAAGDDWSAFRREPAPPPPPDDPPESLSLLTADDPLAVLDRLAQLNLRSSSEPERLETMFPPARDWDAESARQIAEWTSGEQRSLAPRPAEAASAAPPPPSAFAQPGDPFPAPPTASGDAPPGVSRLHRAMRDLDQRPADADEFGPPPRDQPVQRDQPPQPDEPAQREPEQPDEPPESKRSWRNKGGAPRKQKRSRRDAQPDATEAWLSGLASDEPPSWSSARGSRRAAPNFADDDPPPGGVPAQRRPFTRPDPARPAEPARGAFESGPGRHASPTEDEDAWTDHRPDPDEDRWAGLRGDAPAASGDPRGGEPAGSGEDRWAGLRGGEPTGSGDPAWSGRSAPAGDGSMVGAPGDARSGRPAGDLRPGPSASGAPAGTGIHSEASMLGRSQPSTATDHGPAGDSRRAGAANDDFASWWEAAGQGQEGGGADAGGAGTGTSNGSAKPDWAVDPTDPRDTLSGS